MRCSRQIGAEIGAETGAETGGEAEVEDPTPEPPTPEPPTPEPPTPEPPTPEPPTPSPAFELVAVGGDSDPVVNYTQEGDALAAKRQYAEAIQSYQKALDANRKDARALRGLGWAYIEIGSAVQAADNFRSAVNLDSMNAESHYGLGLAYEQLGRNDQAINEYQTYIGLAPNGREATEVRILLRRLLEMDGGT